MSIRLRRLQADYQQVSTLFDNLHPRIRLLETEGTPAERYQFQLRVPGLVVEDDEIKEKHLHQVEVFLPLDYPRRPPVARMLTPVFHPNIDPTKICIGDHWSAGQTLVQLVGRIAEMIAYQSYNVKSPLQAKAAAWAEMNLDQLPLVAGDLMQKS